MDKAIFSGFCLLIICFLAVVYYIKPRMDNSDNQIFGKILITNIAICVIHLTLIFLVRTPVRWLTDAFLHLYLVGMDVWMMLFIEYILSTAFPKAEARWGKLHVYISVTIFTIIVFILPVYPYTGETLNDVYSYGPAVDFTYLWCAVYDVFGLSSAIYGCRKKENRIKLIPVFCYGLFSVISVIIQRFYPETILSTPVLTFVALIMYFTIENPDMKMIDRLRIEKERADRANQAKSDFLATMSHEMKTPLNAIINFALDAEGYSAELSDELKNDIKNIRISTEILSETVGNILEINKFDSGIRELEEVSYDFKKEVRELADITSTRLTGKPVTFTCSVDKSIPQYLIGDKKKVRSIVVNLLSNAFKYTDSGSVELNVTGHRDGDICALEIKVSDTGLGIADDMQDSIFDKFNRLDAGMNTNVEGTGLGLTITKRFVDMMGGTIEVTSKIGVGSTFDVKLSQQIDPKSDSMQQEVEHSFNEFGKLRLLVVDDNALNREVAALQFKNTDITVTEAADGSECLEMIRSGEKFDIILMDIFMPMRGDDTMGILKNTDGFDTPVIALTADGTKEHDAMLEIGFAGLLSKPLDRDSLWHEMDKALRKDK